MKILYHSPTPYDNSSFYRLAPLKYLPNTEPLTYDKHTDWHNLIGATHLVLQRPFIDELPLIHLALDMGIRVIADYDDDLLNIDKTNPCYELYEANRGALLECLNLADEIWVSTEAIKQSFGHPEKTYVIPNAHNDYQFPVSGKREYKVGGKVASWRGGSTHEADMLSVDMAGIINANHDWQFYFIGHRFTHLEVVCGDNYNYHSAIPLMQYFKYMYNLNANIMLFPLADTKFNRAKSNICWLEATYFGSAFMGNTELPEFDKPGVSPIMGFGNGRIDNESSWEYITENLLLSKINKLREERLFK